MLNVGNPLNTFDGELNERNILIHTLNSLKKTSPDYVNRIFQGIHESEKIRYIESVISDSGLFEDITTPSALSSIFKINPSTYRLVFEKGADKVVDDYLSFKNEAKPSFLNIQNIENNYGIKIQESDLDNARISPTIQTINQITEPAANKKSVIEIIAWIVGIVAGLVAIYEFVIKKI